MLINKMEFTRRPINQWDKSSIRPGPVGSVGDALLQVKLKHSSIDLPERYDPAFSKGNEKYLGTNLSDGQWAGYASGGGVARTLVSQLPYRQGFKTQLGWIHEDLRPTARTTEPQMGGAGQYKWKTQVARTYKAKMTGDMFLPLPGGYAVNLASGITRGSSIPRIVAESSGEGAPKNVADLALPPAAVPITDVTFGKTGRIPGQEGAPAEPQAPGRPPVCGRPNTANLFR